MHSCLYASAVAKVKTNTNTPKQAPSTGNTTNEAGLA